MASDGMDRDEVLRAKLVAHASNPQKEPLPVQRQRPAGLFVAVVTAVVLIVVVALSVAALRLTDGSAGPAVGGAISATPTEDQSADAAVPTETLPPGKLLARFTSDDGPNQDHTVEVGGYAIATQFICTGDGKYSVFVANGTSESGDGGCAGGGVGAGGVDVKGTTKVRIRTDPGMTWTYTLVGITPPMRVVLRPVLDPTNTDGSSVPYCTRKDLDARFRAGLDFGDVHDTTSGELVFTNVTGRTCALAGYPEVRFISGGKPLGHHTMNQIDPRRSTNGGLKAVIVAPGESAYSQITWYKPGDNSKFEGACVQRPVNSVQIDLSYDLTAPAQTGTLTVPIGSTIACLNGEHGALGKYGQISSTVFIDYSAH